MPDRDRAARHGSPTARSVHHRIYSAPPTAPHRHSLRPLVIPSLLHSTAIPSAPLHLPTTSLISPSSLHPPITPSSPRHLLVTSSSSLHPPVISTSLHNLYIPCRRYVPPSPPHSLIICASHRPSFVPSSFLRPPRHSGTPLVIPAEAGIHRTITHAERHPTGGHNTTRSTAPRNPGRGDQMRWQSCNRAQSTAGSGSSPLRSVSELVEESKGVETGGTLARRSLIRRQGFVPPSFGPPRQCRTKGGKAPLGTPGT